MKETNNIYMNNKILVFSLSNKKDLLSQKTLYQKGNDSEEFAINISQVKEIISYETGITRMPGKPNYVIGIMNIRGETVPIMDLGYRLNYEIDYPTSKIIIVYMHGEKVGLIVQTVKDVLDFNDNEELEDAPYKEGLDFVVGIVKKHEYNNSEDEKLKQVVNTRVITLLDAEKIIKEEDTKYDLID